MGPETLFSIIVSWVMLFICCPREELKFAPLQEVGTTAMQATFLQIPDRLAFCTVSTVCT